jgi:hypothetical protein
MSINNLTITVGTAEDQFSMVHGTLIKTAATINETPVDIDVTSTSFFNAAGGNATIVRESDGLNKAFAYEGVDSVLSQLSNCTLASGSFDFVANDKIEL